MNFSLCWRSLLLATAVLPLHAALAQPVPGDGYRLQAIDGDNDLGEHFALTPRPSSFNGFFYLADQGG